MTRFGSLWQLVLRSKRRLMWTGFLAVLVHLPLTPAAPVLRMAGRLSTKPTQLEPAPPQQVEVELEQAVRHEHKRQQAQEQPRGKAASVQMEEPPSKVRFAQAAPEPPQPDPAEAAEAQKKAERLRPIGLSGDPDRKLIGRPEVTLGLWFGSLRDTPLAAPLMEIAGCDREWRRFLDEGIQPLNDIDGALMVGPSLFDSTQLTVAVRHHLDKERVRTLVDSLIRTSGAVGRWLFEDAASVRLGKRERVLLPLSDELFFVAPRKGWEPLRRAKGAVQVPSAEGRTLSLSLLHPNRVLQHLGTKLPDSIDELRLEVFTNPDAAVDVRIELEASSAVLAARDAAKVESQLRDLFTDVWTAASALGTISGANSAAPELPPKLDLTLEERTLSGGFRLSGNQTRATLGLLSSFSCKKAKRPSR